MFLIPTYLSESPIHGIGVFTPQPIVKGTVLWRFDPTIDWKIAPEDMAAFPEPYRSRLHAYSYRDKEGTYVLCGDNARFMNHSDDPNCDDSGLIFTVALRDIVAGEELTCDYRSFDTESAAIAGALYPGSEAPGPETK